MSSHADMIRMYLNAEVLDVPPSDFQAKAEAALDALLTENQRLRDKARPLANLPLPVTSDERADWLTYQQQLREALAGDTKCTCLTTGPATCPLPSADDVTGILRAGDAV